MQIVEKSTVILPKTRIKASCVSPKRLVIYSKPKVGKTTATSLLDNCLNLDFEKGTDFVESIKMRVDSLESLKAIGDQILKEDKPYRYITVDTVTAMEDFVMPFAVKLYQETPMGKGYTGTNVFTLPQGSGYLYHRMAMDKVLSYIDTLADRIILLGHIKDKVLSLPDGKEVSSSDIDLTGKVRSIVCAQADAIALMYRKDNKTMLNFKTSDTVICGARPKHLRNKEIVLTTENIDGTITHNWNDIYID